MTLDEIRAELGAASGVPAAALNAASRQADELAPEIYALADKVCRGVYLLPQQANLVFYGLHALAAALQRDLFPCLIRLMRQQESDLDWLFDDHASITMAQLMLSVWDGDADALFQMVEHADVQENARWALFDILARLTFDGKIPRERTAAFLERLESSAFVDDEDSVWWGWEYAVTRLGLSQLEPALQRVWQKSVNETKNQRDRDESLSELHKAAAHPDDPTPFTDSDIAPVSDPAEALAWVIRRQEIAKQWRREVEGPHPAEDNDPAKQIRLTSDERSWLEGFLMCGQAPETTMAFEGIDGLFTALVIGPVVVPPSEYLQEVWGRGAPDWDSPEQAEYVMSLLMWHWNSIVARRMAGGPIQPAIDPLLSETLRGQLWADGFEAGIGLREEAWAPLLTNRRMSEIVLTVLDLAFDPTNGVAKPVSPARRKKIIEQLPTLLKRISDYWKDPAAVLNVHQPIRSTKIGRNEPCPCGSGKKYKKCCGGAVTVH